MWYYSQNNQQLGPIAEEQLKSMLRGSSLTGSTLVWKEGMSDWKPVTEVPELAISLTASAPTVGPISSSYNQQANPYSAPQSQVTRSYSPQPAMGPPINGGGILAFAIVVTVMCCLPLGIAGIVYAAQINSKLAVGDYLGAAESARQSKMWSWIGFGIGAVLNLLLFASVSFSG
jgi:GYF domain 2/Interferon-induced transmembrane protein